MCFRPTEMSMKKCPKCGANNKPIATECAQCGTPLEQMKIDFDADQAKLDAANMFGGGMPPMPGMPPAAPKVPSAPKPPAPPSV